MILLTGGSGFIGSNFLNAQKDKRRVVTLGRSCPANSLYHLNLNLVESTLDIRLENLTKVVHLAGKAHIVQQKQPEGNSYNDVNSRGTIHLLNALEKANTIPKTFVLASTVAVYGLEEGERICEDHELKPTTLYAKSKLEAENHVITWCKSNGVSYLILRLPLVVGMKPPGNLSWMIKAISEGKYMSVLNNRARKSMVLLSDVIELINNYEGEVSGIYNLTSSDHPKFEEIEKALEHRLQRKIRMSVPHALLKPLAWLGDLICVIFRINFPLTSMRLKKLTLSLTFCDNKAREELDWSPNSVLPFLKHVIR